ncbi:MAG: M48 family metallopeptidase [Planctomycetota bacterium]
MRLRLPTGGRRRRKSSPQALKIRLLIAVAIAAVALISYLGTSSTNPITGQNQRVGIQPAEEIALGLQAVPSLKRQFGGEEPDAQAQARLDRIGWSLVAAALKVHGTDDPVYDFEFTLLADDEVVNAFALPGGQTFITDVLFDQLDDDQLAAVMGHEIAHVVHRHGAERMTKQEFFQQLGGAAGVASGDASGAQIANQLLNVAMMKYGREDERECDHYGLLYMAEAGYDPWGMVELLSILAEASGGQRPPEILSTHPHPEERIGLVKQQIAERFPHAVPPGAAEAHR